MNKRNAFRFFIVVIMLYIRVDANEIIATGHLMRCLSIADAAKKLGENTVFILADDGVKHIVESKGYKTIVLYTPWNDMNQEIGKIVTVIKENKIAKLLLDSYQVTERYLEALSNETKVTYIDDLDKFLYPVDTLICYAAYAGKFDYPSKYPGTKLLLGTEYAPLRQEFCGLEKKEIRKEIGNILVLSGGTDRMNVLQRILDALVPFDKIHIDAICGIYNSNYDMLCERYASRENITLHHSTENILSYMRSADVAVSAAGTTLYELCACGTPTISYVIADNQINNAAWFAENNMIQSAGDARTDNLGSSLANMLSAYGDCAYRENLSVRMQQFVDGQGTERIARHLMNDANM